MKTTNKIHYVYKITNLNPTDERLYYIGVRSTSKASAELDTNYRSSSKSLKAVIKEIGYKDFDKTILSIWRTRKLANQEEIRLHKVFDVAKNPQYYNKSKSMSSSFCTEGQVTVLDTRDNATKNVSTNDFNMYAYYISCMKGSVMVKDLSDGINKRVSIEEYKTNKNYIHINGKSIKIYNNNGNLVDTIEGGFKTYCMEKEFPFNALKISYQNNGKPIYTDTKSNIGRLMHSGLIKYKGWYAIESN